MSDLAKGWTPLHQAALEEAQGRDVAAIVAQLLQAGADPHREDAAGETPFNIAAPASPVTGRLMTLHWLESALSGQGSKRLNDLSGSHGSTLAQYMAKWLNDEEIDGCIESGIRAGLKVDVPNKSGWTPLAAAAAMGRISAVGALLRHYTKESVLLKTVESYSADYGSGRRVVYPAGMTSAQISHARLEQDKGLSITAQGDLAKVVAVILLFIAD